jgi:hypothetical protein
MWGVIGPFSFIIFFTRKKIPSASLKQGERRRERDSIENRKGIKNINEQYINASQNYVTFSTAE